MSDPFETHPVERESPFEDGVEVAPDDDVDLPVLARGLWIGSGGTLRITTKGGTVLNLTVAAGLVPWAARRVHATGTSATGIVAGW